ncbi:HpcH/HpaI aldolase family protein [Alkalilimnicola sp. S0819]|uniref:HpcH/HpaI aldolase family protein n=1 Tax=Alkalilimnicola sp. S0819 TaxID=2613922 RepID=UPI001261DDA1|nr:HpcH/HpaI aldolase/citrate lyase family protein [Alkalilimnicola sp. S0819]KAB7623931.1 HpcH/HpaI aldolase/citrate lyase family protein [Alkalilimnicola sp. S0819]MPQ16529.1 2-dehydro-3-deoxyglucarate aldolase [Alkalilimnicola sp. S0819]
MDIPQNRFKAALADGQTLYGLWVAFGSAYPAEVCATTGYDWLLIDGEHAPNSVPSVLEQLQVVMPYPVSAVVRPVNGDPALIKQYLDVGAQTLMVPMVDCAEQAEALVRATRYATQGGIRGVGGGLTRATRWGAIHDYTRRAHEQTCLIVQVESRQGAERIEEIAAVDGVDAVFIGPVDLSTDMGYPDEPHHPEVQAMIRHLIEVVNRAGKAAGILAPNADDARRYRDWGCRFIAVGIDISLLRQGALDTLAQFKPDAEPSPPARGY